jgi:hypothetical protein
VAGRRGQAWCERARDVAARSAARLKNVSQCPCSNAKISKKMNRSAQVVKRKVVDLTNVYNFYKGSRVFFSTDFAQIAAKL